MNGLFQRIDHALARERAFTADAAHELRTPVAVLLAQWDVVRRSHGSQERAQAEARLGAGLDRLDRLVNQMLALSRIEGAGATAGEAGAPGPVDWRQVVEQAVSDCLPLAERRGIEFDCELPLPGQPLWRLQGNEALLTVMLRNLLDNAARYAPAGSTVRLSLAAAGLVVENDAEPLADDTLARLGERFYRPDGQDEVGSGLGLSIVQRVALQHGLTVRFARLGAERAGRGLRVEIWAPGASRPAPGSGGAGRAGRLAATDPGAPMA